jgi:hypothetical protein
MDRPFVEHVGADPGVGGIAECGEFRFGRVADAHAQDHPAAGQPVDCDRLARHHPRSMTWHCRHHRADSHRPGGLSYCSQQHPWVRHRNSIGDHEVVPYEEPVPSGVLGGHGQRDDVAGLRVRSEIRKGKPEMHIADAINNTSRRSQVPIGHGT